MKNILLAAFLLVTAAFNANAQQNKSVVGKWKLVKLETPEITFDMENPAATRKALAAQIEAESGQKADSATLDMAMQSVFLSIGDMQFNFDTNGTVVMNVGDKNEKETYTVDYTKGILTTYSVEKKQTQVMQMSFVGDKLILNVDEKGKKTVLTLKKV